MKYLITAIAYLLLTAASCKKTPVQQEDQLPPITQTGAKTFGCLVNGKVYIPKGTGSPGEPNYKAVYDVYNGRPYLFIKTVRYVNGFDGEINFSIDSLSAPGIYLIKANKNHLVLGGNFFNRCSISAYDTTSYQKGSFNISKIDLQNGIFSGTFNCTIKPPNCDTIHITEGRFDYKF